MRAFIITIALLGIVSNAHAQQTKQCQAEFDFYSWQVAASMQTTIEKAGEVITRNPPKAREHLATKDLIEFIRHQRACFWFYQRRLRAVD